MIGLIAVAVAAYISTNIDDLLLLCAFSAHPAYSTTKIVAGQFIGIGILVVASLILALTSVVIPLAYVGLLGIAPVYLGCSRVLTRSKSVQRPTSSSRQTSAVITATIADGGDNVATYVPIFAGSDGTERLAIIAVFAALAGLWCWMAGTMLEHPIIGRTFGAWSTRLLPYMLISLGFIGLWRNGSFELIEAR
jgi:cadmium resistance protein CadD (predicted permease)